MPLLDLLAKRLDRYGRVSQAVQDRWNTECAGSAGLAIVPLGPIDLYGKAGVLSGHRPERRRHDDDQQRTNGFYGSAWDSGRCSACAPNTSYDVSAVDGCGPTRLGFRHPVY
jgi:hypothetical protein